MSRLRLLGFVLAAIGTLAAMFPHWFGFLTGANDTLVDAHEAIEQRVRGGMVLSLGLIFIGVTALRPWSISIPLAICFFMAGALAARLLGMMIHGPGPKQWLVVGVEAVFMAATAFWLWHSTGTGQ
ncbi:MAG: hypothetical protein CMH56_02020 [Myxococcales bacterium]|nr:hypothetical protein [Myxococcales bacterium]